MTTRLEPIRSTERPALERIFQLYLHDMSAFVGWSLGLGGAFAFPEDLLPPYWERDDHWPYFVYSDDILVGFSLIRVAPNCPGVFDMGQFFVSRAFRGTGLAKDAFHQSVAAHPGKWQVRVLADNTPARRFWDAAVAEVANASVQTSQEPYGQQQMIYYRFEAG